MVVGQIGQALITLRGVGAGQRSLAYAWLHEAAQKSPTHRRKRPLQVTGTRLIENAASKDIFSLVRSDVPGIY